MNCWWRWRSSQLHPVVYLSAMCTERLVPELYSADKTYFTEKMCTDSQVSNPGAHNEARTHLLNERATRFATCYDPPYM